MDGFFPEKFLVENVWDEYLLPENQSDSLQHTEIPRIGFGQESLHVGSNSQDSKDEDHHLPPANHSDFLQYSDFPGVGFGQESSQNGSNPNQTAFVQYIDPTRIGFGQESSCSFNVTDHGHGPSPPANRSAFVPYRELPRNGFGQESSRNGFSGKISRRMIEFLKRSCPVERTNVTEYERERGFRHMLNERMRRQRQRECCMALHSMLPYGTKNDINSVIQAAAKEIQRLQAYREELQGENCELEANVKALESSKIQFRVANPTSPIDSMIETLQIVKGLGVNTRSISSSFSPQELLATLEIEDKIGDGEVGRAIQRALNEIGRKTASHDPEVSKRQKIGMTCDTSF